MSESGPEPWTRRHRPLLQEQMSDQILKAMSHTAWEDKAKVMGDHRILNDLEGIETQGQGQQDRNNN